MTENEKQFQRLFNKALVFQSQNNTIQAIEYYSKALTLKADHLPTIQVLALLLQQENHLDRALQLYQHAIELHPHSAALHNALANCYDQCNELERAKTHYLHVINLRQDHAEALNNYGNICRKLGEYDQAEESLLAALRLRISVETLGNLGLLMADMHKFPNALSFYDHALRIQPDNALIQWNKALLLLSQGYFEQGWQLYDVGLAAGTRPRQLAHSDDAQFDISYFHNKSVYIHSEQGIGDEIMFASCFHEIISVTSHCTIECDDRLLPLFQRAFKNAHINAKSLAKISQLNTMEKDIDISISMASLPRFVRTSFADFAPQKAYLIAEERFRRCWRMRYRKVSNKFNIGISWQGGLAEEARKRSSELHHWERLLKIQDVQFINLQYGDVNSALEKYESTIKEWPDTDHFHNIEQLAAQISALDLVITVSNVTAHLAGALGIPVWILLPYASNWRWFNGYNPSPWYSSAQVYRQQSPGDWPSVFKLVERDLLSVLENSKKIEFQSMSVG